jgi:hypothetical protein
MRDNVGIRTKPIVLPKTFAGVREPFHAIE